MPNTYTQIYLHIVFAVKGRENLILENWEDQLYKYITGVIKQKNQKLFVINGYTDHIHILLSLSANCNLSELVKDIKVSSSKYINENKLSKYKFQWQNGYGAFSYSKSQVDKVYKYINNQKEHHKKYSFKDEYIKLLQKFEIEYNFKNLFDWID